MCRMAETAEAAPGLRERKKRRTREAIVAAAYRLFEERGFDATTIADIAAAADIAPRTFFGYFATKEEVVFHDLAEVEERFATRLRGRAAGATTFDALRAWVVEWLRDERDPLAGKALRERLVACSATLRGQDRANAARFEALIAEGVAADLGLQPEDLRPRLVGAAAVAALEAVRNSAAEPPEPERALAVLDEALVFLEAGLEALRRRPPA
jgi:AcrR family transcriptional regulator